MMTIDRGILLKTMLVVIYCMPKYYITILLLQFTETLNQFLNLSRGNENLEIVCLLEPRR